MPSKKNAPPPRLRVRRTGRVKTLETLGERASVVRDLGPKSPLCAAGSPAAAALAEVGTTHDAAKAADAEATTAEHTAEAKRTTANIAALALADALGLYEHHVELRAGSPDEAQGAGVVVMVEKSYDLEAPRGLRVTVNHDTTGVATARILLATGLTSTVLELSSDGGVTFKEYPGVGAVRKMAGLAIGSYQARAAHLRGSERSPYTTPVVFTIK